jgi:hypothetical protein
VRRAISVVDDEEGEEERLLAKAARRDEWRFLWS